MLRPPSSPAPWPGASSHPCARCGELTASIGLGELCPKCSKDVTRKASRTGRFAAVVTTLLLAGYLVVTLRCVAPAWQTTARTVGAAAAVAWYLLSYRIVQRIALEWLKTRRP